MIPKGLFTQIGMVIVAVAIVITYIKPTFAEIGVVQDSIKVYQDERKKVISVNSQLSSLMTRLESITNSDQRKLFTYLPNEMDEISVQRDFLIISEEAGVLYKSSNYSEPSSNRGSRDAETPEDLPEEHAFELSVEGTYGQVKNLFRLLEKNHYPLEVKTVSISRLEGDFLSVNINFAAYTYKAPVNNN